MKIDKVSYSESREVVTPTGLTRWHKMGMDGTMEDGDIPELCMLELKNKVQLIYDADESDIPVDTNSYSPSPGYKKQKYVPRSADNSVKVQADPETRKKYAKAVAAQDKPEIERLESIYQFQPE